MGLLLDFDYFPESLVKILDSLVEFFLGLVFFAHVGVQVDKFVVFLLEFKDVELEK